MVIPPYLVSSSSPNGQSAMATFFLFPPLSAINTTKGDDPSIASFHLFSPSSPSRITILPSNGFSLSSRASPSRPFFICHSSKKKETSFTDRILDYIEGGPKLRKWYGASNILPKDGGLKEENDESYEIEEARDAVLVTNGESEIGQMVILLLIVKRARIKALVKDKKASVDAFGTYVEALVGDLSNMAFLSKALRGVRAIICPANIIMAYLQDGFFSVVGLMKGIEHVILLSQLDAYKGSGIFQAIINKRLRKYAERDEEVVITSGIPYTIVKAGLLQDVHSGEQGFCFDEGVASRGRLDREVAARICVEALDVVPTKGLIFEAWTLGRSASYSQIQKSSGKRR
ncbi:uncharacterized protein At2g37660, chloroplastic isoform X2 [Phalaenopsis equestris]|uniref:uncharacterized protein At2g37660, chloroplastic isoform X2 n=1 Tax=Phalaenopsis equestris TaxID=78828 RepID=UPI0009E2C594|nr:uncharacterized protein At2g37660, chloroplastic isoform X2 [Phalaenopsis equestris]